MGKRYIPRRPALAWLAVFGVLVSFILAASWGRSFIGVTVKPIVISEEAPQETPPGMAAPHGEALSGPPPAYSSDDAASAQKQQKGAATPFRFPGFDVVDPAIAQKMEEERQAMRDEVARETLEESVRNLLTHNLSLLFSPYWCGRFAAPDWNAGRLSEELAADPRIARLLDVIRHGSSEEANVVYWELRNAINSFLFELTLIQPIGEPPMPTVMNPWSGNALPMLLAAFPASVEHLELLVAMLDRIETAHQADILETWQGAADAPLSLGSMTTTLLTYSIAQILSGLVDQEYNDAAFTPEQGEALEAYRQYREYLRALTQAAIQELVEDDSFAPDQALEALSNPERLDELSWYLAHSLGYYMQPRETFSGFLIEDEIRSLARAICDSKHNLEE